MHADGTAIVTRPPTTRSRVTNRPGKMVLDGRTALGRRILDLANAFAARLGGWSALSDTAAADVRRAAELTGLAEQARADALRSGNVDPIALARIEGVADRATRRLKLPQAEGREATLGDYLADDSEAAA
jgi:hypothetical protein